MSKKLKKCQNAEKIFIQRVYNGYQVTTVSRNNYDLPDGPQYSWSFETIAKLQQRLPEIIGRPYELIEIEQTKQK